MLIEYTKSDDSHAHCSNCHYYSSGKYAGCLISSGGVIEAEKIKNGLIGKCSDFIKSPARCADVVTLNT